MNRRSTYFRATLRHLTTSAIILALFRYSLVEADDARPAVAIVVDVPGRSVADIVPSVLVPVEQAFEKGAAIARVRSASSAGRGFVWVDLAERADPAAALQLMNERLSLIRDRLPADAEITIRSTASDRSALVCVGLRSERFGSDLLSGVAETYLRPRLAAIEGVAEIRVFGGTPYQCGIDIDLEALERRSLDVAVVAEGVTKSGLLLVEKPPGGARNADAPAAGNSPEKLGEVVIAAPDGQIVRLQDVARITIGGDPLAARAAFYEAGGDPPTKSSPGVILAISVAPGRDIAKLLQAVDRVWDDASASIPADIEMRRRVFKPSDESVFLQLPDSAGIERRMQAAERTEAVLTEVSEVVALWRLPNSAVRPAIGPDVEFMTAYDDDATPADRKRVREELLRRLAMFPDLLTTVGPCRLGRWDDPLDAELAVVITGSDSQTLRGSAEKFREHVAALPGLTTVFGGGTRFEQQVNFLPPKLKELGIGEPACRIAMTAVQSGLVVGRFNGPFGPPMPVVIRAEDGGDREPFGRLKLKTKSGELIRLADVATISREPSSTYEYRENGRPAAVIGCDSAEPFTDADLAALKKALESIIWPAGQTWRIVRRGTTD
jgi:multidrug efflux pump subunit AcrB